MNGQAIVPVEKELPEMLRYVRVLVKSGSWVMARRRKTPIGTGWAWSNCQTLRNIAKAEVLAWQGITDEEFQAARFCK